MNDNEEKREERLKRLEEENYNEEKHERYKNSEY